MLKYIIILLSSFFLLFSSCNKKSVRRIHNLNTDYTGKTINSLKGDCIVEFDEIDKFSGRRITKLKEERIFTFTHKKLKQYFTDRPFIEAYGSLSKSDNKVFLNLKFKIDTKHIKTGYNGISKSSMRISLIQGDNVYVNNIISDQGRRDVEANFIVYKGVFPIAKEDIKLLKKYELDKIGVNWNGGVEEYEIYNIDFIIKQLECFKEIR